jgi:hypothetical protein
MKGFWIEEFYIYAHRSIPYSRTDAKLPFGNPWRERVCNTSLLPKIYPQFECLLT